jgi:HEAT repeat protein
MWKRVQVALAVLVIFSSGVAMWQLLRSREPRYQGKLLSAWLVDFDFESAHSPEKARQAVRTIGTNSFPILRRMLQSKDPIWTKAIIALDDRQSVIQVHVTRANVIRYRAVQGYSALGAGAKEDVLALIALLDVEPSAEVRCDVATVLGGIGSEAKAAIPLLWKTANAQNPGLRTSALSALANIQGWFPERPGF